MAMEPSASWPAAGGSYAPTLDLRGPRGGLTGAAARELVKGVVSGDARDYERVILSTWGFSVEAAEVVAGALALLPKLRSAVLADIIAGRPEAEGLAVYRALGAALRTAPLEEIDLSDNAVGTKGVEACSELLGVQARLERIFFSNCGISAEAARSIADVLLFRAPTVLRAIHFHNNMSGAGGAAAVADVVAASPALVDVRFTSSRGGPEGGVALARAFVSTPALERINFHDNLFAVPTAVELGSALCGLNRLRHLDVGDTLVRDAGMAALAAGLLSPGGPRHSLEFLDVSENELSHRGASSLASALRALTRLRTLIAHGNEFGGKGAAALARALSSRASAAPDGVVGDSLVDVNVRACDLGSAGSLLIARAAVQSLPALVALDVSGNDVSRAAAVRIRAAASAKGLREGIIVLAGGGDDDDEDVESGDEEEEEVEVVALLAADAAAVARAAAAAAAAAPAPANADKELDALVGGLSSLTT